MVPLRLLLEEEEGVHHEEAGDPHNLSDGTAPSVTQSLRIAAIFIIFAASILGSFPPILLGSRLGGKLSLLFKALGTGARSTRIQSSKFPFPVYSCNAQRTPIWRMYAPSDTFQLGPTRERCVAWPLCCCIPVSDNMHLIILDAAASFARFSHNAAGYVLQVSSWLSASCTATPTPSTTWRARFPTRALTRRTHITHCPAFWCWVGR